MIIVSQNKREIINFSNMLKISFEQCIIFDGKDYTSKDFNVFTISETGKYSLGIYETEEMSLKVINEIIKRYKLIEDTKIRAILFTSAMEHGNNYIEAVYYMPEV